jgi:branched-chain amino acid transport system ATP-binding protein
VTLPAAGTAIESSRVGDVVLSVRGVTVRYGGIEAVSDVSLDVRQGELHGLIGPNGAGKTSFIDAISGFEPPVEGRVVLDDVEIDRWPPHKRARAGLTRTFQHLELYADLTVRENLIAAADASGSKRARVDEAAELVGIQRHLDHSVKDLAHGVRRLVAVARAVATEPRVLVLDEPASGLDNTETEALGLALRELVDGGVGLLLVDHDMALVMGVSRHVTVLDQGRVIADGTPLEVVANPAVRVAYLGEV